MSEGKKKENLKWPGICQDCSHFVRAKYTDGTDINRCFLLHQDITKQMKKCTAFRKRKEDFLLEEDS